MAVPQPFQYQGSQWALAPLILPCLSIRAMRLVHMAQPFPAAGRLSYYGQFSS
jgi:hypothetical protein